MSTCEVILPSQDVSQIVESVATSVAETIDTSGKDDEEKSKPTKARVIYTQEQLLDLRAVPASLKRPDTLAEEFYTQNGIWDPSAWHKSVTSRSATPTAEGRPLSETKKMEMFGDTIELTPQRRSFHEGCHVQNRSESQSESKHSFVRPIKNDNTTFSDGKGRLTGRAAGQRKSLEKAYFKDRDGDINIKKQGKLIRDQDNGREFRRDRDSKFDDRPYERIHADSESSLPEWAIDGPTSQSDTIELKGFDDDAERRDNMRRKNSSQMRSKKKQQSVENDARNSPATTTSSSKRSSAESTKNNENEHLDVTDASKDNAPVRKTTPVDNLFDFNDVLNLLDFVPTEMFEEEDTAGKSRFCKWFQHSRSNSRGSNSSGSRPSSVPLFPDQATTAAFARALTPENAGLMSNSYFTPIQPAPPCTVPSPEVPSLLEIIQKAKNTNAAAKPQPVREIRGRMTVDDIEPPQTGEAESVETNEACEKDRGDRTGQSAFEKLVQTMKKSGQLPEKPAPVVTGLPEHLLPKPPKKTSPTFEKLKRQLSRSPSPLSFLNRPYSPIVHQSGLLTPEFFKQSLTPKTMPPSEFFKHTQEHDGIHSRDQSLDNPKDVVENRFVAPEDEKRGSINQVDKSTAKVPTAFMPTSVMKKMHNEKLELKEIPVKGEAFPKAVGQPIGPPKYQEQLLTEQLKRACELPFSSTSTSQDSLTSIFSSPRSDKARSLSNDTPWHDSSCRAAFYGDDSGQLRNLNDILNHVRKPMIQQEPPFSAPNTPASKTTGIVINSMGPQSAPVTPKRDPSVDPPTVNRIIDYSRFLPPKYSNDSSRVVGSNSKAALSDPSNNVQDLTANACYLRTGRSDSPRFVHNSDNIDPSVSNKTSSVVKGRRHPDFHDDKLNFGQEHPPHTSDNSELLESIDMHARKQGIVLRQGIRTEAPCSGSQQTFTTLNQKGQMAAQIEHHPANIFTQQMEQHTSNSTSLHQKPNGRVGSDAYQQSPVSDPYGGVGSEQGMTHAHDGRQSSKHGSTPNTSSSSNNKKGHGVVGGQFQKVNNPSRKRISPPIPAPLQPSPLTANIPPSLGRNPGVTNVGAAIAAQAMVQKHMMAQAARAHVLQAAQFYQQQQQQQVFRAQVQAALMAQTIARNKTLMYNQRAMANHPTFSPSPTQPRMPTQANSIGRPGFTPLLPLQQQNQMPPFQVKNNTPVHQYPCHDRSSKAGILSNTEPGLTDNPLSKWFGKDMLETTKRAPTVDPSTKAKMLCVEEIEQMQ